MNRNLLAIKIFFIALIVFIKGSVSAADITISWDPSSTVGVAGYAVYYGYKSGEYPTRIDAGNNLNVTFPVENGINYFFVVTAYNFGGIESLPSDEVSYLSDTSSPQVVVSFPSSNPIFLTTNNSVSLAGTANDNFGIAQVTWSNRCNGVSGIAAGTTNWNVNEILLCNGTNVIEITAQDLDSNIGSALYTVVRNDPCGQSFASGSFNGLITDALAPERSGYFTLRKGNFESFSGNVNLGGWRRGFSGRFTNGIATVSITRKDADPLVLQLQTEICEQDRMTGTLMDGGNVATLIADRAVFHSRTNPAPASGKYTLAVFGTSEAPILPEGIGFATARVLANGAIRVQGTLGDGKNFAQSTYLSKDGFWPFYASPYRKTGNLISGWLVFNSQVESDLHGDLFWTKPAITNDAFYPFGFSNLVAAIGSSYVAPTNSNNRILEISEGTVTLAGGELVHGFAKDVILETNKVVPASKGEDKLSFRINNSLGSFSGTIQLPEHSTRIRFRGGLLQKKNAGYGLFSGTNKIGQVMLEPAP